MDDNHDLGGGFVVRRCVFGGIAIQGDGTAIWIDEAAARSLSRWLNANLARENRARLIAECNGHPPEAA